MRVSIFRKHGHEVIDLNRRRAIRERCMNCLGWNHGRVRGCDFENCELYPYRSGQGKQDAKKRSMAIRRYCLWCCANQPNEVRHCSARDCPLFAYRQSATDKSVKVGVRPKKGHIGASQRDKNQNAVWTSQTA